MVSAVVLGASNSYIVPDTPAGTFENFTANEVGRSTGKEFWDNRSDDGGISGVNPIRGCSIGFYATDRMTDCSTYEKLGSTANAAGNAYTFMWSDGVKSAAFSFNRGTSYTVTFKGAYSLNNSAVGYYTKAGSVYTFTEVPAWTNKTLPAVAQVINTGIGTWGFFIANADVVGPGCGTYKTFKVACSDATGGQVMNPLQQFALFANAGGTSYLVGAEDRSVEQNQPNDSDYNDYLWTITPTPCDFVTFGRLVTEVGGMKVVISGNAGGNAPGGGILGEFRIDINGVDYHVSDIATYGAIVGGPLNSRTNSRVITGVARNGTAVELRLWDGGEPGKDTDRVYVKLGTGAGESFPLGSTIDGRTIDQGNMQYHPTCRGPT